jgi:cobalamin biosynthesis protein CobD/CbiB
MALNSNKGWRRLAAYAAGGIVCLLLVPPALIYIRQWLLGFGYVLPAVIEVIVLMASLGGVYGYFANKVLKVVREDHISKNSRDGHN